MNKKSFSNLFYITVIIVFAYFILELLMSNQSCLRKNKMEYMAPVDFETPDSSNASKKVISKSSLQKMFNDGVISYIWGTPKTTK